MTTQLAVIFFLSGIIALWIGGEAVVRSTMSFAKIFKIGAFTLSLTLLAAATSGPELFFNVLSALRGDSTFGLGNALGANIANFGLIFAIATLFIPLKRKDDEAIWAYPSLLAFSLFFFLLGIDGTLDRVEGGILVGLFVIWAFLAIKGEHKKRLLEKLSEILPEHSDKKHISLTLTLFIASIVLLVGGAELLVDSVTHFAGLWEISPLLLSSVMVALGTTLPEFATTIVAVVKKRYDVRSGTLFGSNVFNLSLIVGVAALIQPIHFSKTNFGFLAFLIIVTTMLAAPIIFNFKHHSRLWSILLLTTYIFFIIFISTELIF